MRRWTTLLGALTILLLPLPEAAEAWDSIGHQVVSRIAWDQMQPETRAAAVALLKQAPADSDLPDLFPNDSRPLEERDRELFLLASTWPDIVRDEAFPERRERYHRSSSHYINFFWEQPGPNAPPRDRTDLQPQSENAVERLEHFETALADESRPPADRAIDLAWVLHLVGDLHQPLHNSARVTPVEPEGDRGGSLFLLDDGDTLHWYWDGILGRTFLRRGDSEARFVDRITAYIEGRYPRSVFESRLAPGDFKAWSKEGFQTSKTAVYPESLRRNVLPSQCYRQQAFAVAEPAIALAGYRLAEMLDRVLR